MEPTQPTNTSPKKSTSTGLITGIVAIILLAGVALAALKYSDDKNMVATVPTDNSSVPVATTTDTTSTPADTTAKYKNGTYSADGSYSSPGGNDTISVTLTLQGDIVTDATVAIVQADSTSKRYENMFIAGFKQYVVGMNIDALNVTKVSGSSLTVKGFDDAVAKIKVAAQA